MLQLASLLVLAPLAALATSNTSPPVLAARTFLEYDISDIIGQAKCHNGFWHPKKDVCMNFQPQDDAGIPDGKTCPYGWNWKASRSTCAPESAAYLLVRCPSALPFLGSSSDDFACKVPAGASTAVITTSACHADFEFLWTGRQRVRACCTSKAKTTNTPPADVSCPTGWSYGGASQRFCIPSTAAYANDDTPDGCAAGHRWYPRASICAPYTFDSDDEDDCDDGKQFFWKDAKKCCSKDRPATTTTPTEQRSCPTTGDWAWDSRVGHCVPLNKGSCPNSGTVPSSCQSSSTSRWLNHYWDASSQSCHALVRSCSSSSSCSKNEFWWSEGERCISKGSNGDCPSTGETPPSTKNCPSNYQWTGGPTSGHCAPKNSGACGGGRGQCSSGSSWFESERCCKSNHSNGSKRRAQEPVMAPLPFGVVDPSRCPFGLMACPTQTQGLVGASDYECLSPLTEIESCGGCASLGQGTDCTAIIGARSVGCEAGVCAVYSCAKGFTIGPDGKTCVRTRLASLTSHHRRVSRTRM